MARIWTGSEKKVGEERLRDTVLKIYKYQRMVCGKKVIERYNNHSGSKHGD